MVAQPAVRHTDHQLHEKLVALSRNAQVNVDLDDPADYWYRLGQRNAYAHALGLSVAEGVDQVAFTVSDRLTDALSNGEQDVEALLTHGLQGIPAPASKPEDWIGPQAFQAKYGQVLGVDRDFGVRWGEKSNQRISWRAPLDASHGLLYAYDRLWDEYLVLGTNVPIGAVESAFKQALACDVHMEPTVFAEIVRSEVILAQRRPVEPVAEVRVIQP